MKQSTLELLFTVLFALIGMAFIVYGVLQLTGVVAPFNAWSDAASMLIGINLLVSGWFINNGRPVLIIA